MWEFLQKIWATLFKDNKILFKLVVQDILYREFKKRPQLKQAVLTAVNKTITYATPDTMSKDLFGNLKAYLNISALTPPEQELVNEMVSQIVSGWDALKVKNSITTEFEQYKDIMEILSWIAECSKN